MNEEQLRKELEEAKQLIKLLKEEVGFAERGYTQKGWVKSYCGGKPNYCTPEVTPDVDAVNMSQDRVDETAKSKREWVGLTDEEIHEVVSKKWWDWEDAFDIEGFSRAIEAKLKEKNT